MNIWLTHLEFFIKGIYAFEAISKIGFVNGNRNYFLTKLN